MQRDWQRQSKREVRSCCPCSQAYIASFPGRRRNGLATSMSSNCYFRCQSWQYQSNFRILSHENRKTQLRQALNCHSHTHSISIVIARIGALHDDCFSNDFHKQERPVLTAGKFVSITCTNPVLIGRMRYCNYLNVRSVYSLNLWKLPDRFSYDLGTRLRHT